MPAMRRGWLTLAGAGLAIVCLVLFSRQVAGLVSDGSIDLLGALPQLVPASCAFLVAYAAFASGWHALLLAGRVPASWRVSSGIFATTQFGKYLPGNVGHHLGRVALAASYGFPGATVVATMVVEAGLVLAWMAVLGLPLLEFWLGRLDLDVPALVTALAGAGILLGGASVVLHKQRRHPRIAALLEAVDPLLRPDRRSKGLLAVSAALILAGIVLSALSLSLLDPGGTLLSFDAFPITLGLFACAWLLGFVTPGAPAGIGIRELILTEGLTPLVGREQAVVIALTFRILSTGSDLLVLLAGLGMLSGARRRHPG